MSVNIRGKTHMTVSDVARKWGVSIKTISNWIDGKIIPEPPKARKGLRYVRIFPTDYIRRAEKMLEQHARNSEKKGRAQE